MGGGREGAKKCRKEVARKQNYNGEKHVKEAKCNAMLGVFCLLFILFYFFSCFLFSIVYTNLVSCDQQAIAALFFK